MAVVNSKIQWTQNTWNPTSGCTKVSAGCNNCYAERITERLRRELRRQEREAA